MTLPIYKKMKVNLSEFISNNVYLNKLINNKIKKGKKGTSIKVIHNFLNSLNNYKYEEVLLLSGYQKGNISKEYKKNIGKLTVNLLLLCNSLNSNISIKRKYLLIKINSLFKRITPVILMSKLPLKKKKFSIILPMVKRNNKSQINKSIRFFIKHTSLALSKKGLRKDNVLKSFINEYKRLKRYTSKCIKEKLNLYRTLNLTLFRFKYRYKYKKL
jgi:hypothetical protein